MPTKRLVTVGRITPEIFAAQHPANNGNNVAATLNAAGEAVFDVVHGDDTILARMATGQPKSQ